MCVGPWRMSHFPFSIFNFTFETGGYVSIANEGAARAVLFQVEDGVTNRIDASTRIRLDVADDSFTRECVKTVYMSCPVLGRGTLRATWTPEEDAGEELSAEADYQVIEPIRKLVSSRFPGDLGVRLLENPSRLVYGTNAVLCVDVNLAKGDEFALTNVQWTVSGAAEKVSTVVTNGFSYCIVRPLGDSGVAVAEARFNGDEVQPRFVLPVVRPRTIPIRMFVVSPPELEQDEGWENSKILRMLPLVNCIYGQVGIRFELQGDVETIPNSSQYWTLNAEEYVWEWTWSLIPFQRKIVATQQSLSLMSHYTAGDCVEIYFTGKIVSEPRPRMAAYRLPQGIAISKKCNFVSLAHELGHALGLKDCYDFLPLSDGGESMLSVNTPVDSSRFSSSLDWGAESGTGFYRFSDTHSRVMWDLLMYGVSLESLGIIGCDIPDGEFEGLSVDSKNRRDLKHIAVGAQNIEPLNGKVYSR